MAKSVSIPLGLCDGSRGGSTRAPPRKWPSTSLAPSHSTPSRSMDSFILSIVERDGRCSLYGSAAESAGLSIGDEVVAVNGRSVEGSSHDQLLNTIQQCIRSRSVSLRVRRLKKENIGDLILNKSATVKEAILVSVNDSERDGIIEKINQSYPGISTYDMEEVANGGTHLHPKVHFVSNGAASNEQNGEESRIKRYDEDIRERKERQLDRQKEKDLLRSSLRASKKLSLLASERKNGGNGEMRREGKEEVIETPLDEVDALQGLAGDEWAGYENESCLVSDDSSCRETLHSHDHNGVKPTPFDQIILSVERIADVLASSEGRPEESRLIRDFFTSPPIQSAIQASSNHHTGDVSRGRVCHEEIGPSDHIRILTLYKDDNAYLGATVRHEDSRVVVGRVVAGGIAERTELLHEGDELLEVNGLELRGRNVGEVCDVLRGLRGEIRLVVNSEGRRKRDGVQRGRRLRALFDYNPNDDPFVPCRELGLPFLRGDVLHIVDTSDVNWWQATLDGRHPLNQLAGIVPSPAFRQQVLLYQGEEMEGKTPKSRKDARKIIPDLMKTMKKGEKDLMIRDENGPILPIDGWYEEVSLHLARSSHKRPLVLVAPEGTGALHLRQSLLEMAEDRLAAPIPYTSRSAKEGEINGVHYHFVSRAKLIEMGKTGQLIEFGEFEKNLYGTAMADIISVRERGKTCVLTLKPQSLWSIRVAQVMPFIVFISPPSAVQLRRQKEIMGERNVTDEQLKTIIAQGKSIQQDYGHLFDASITNTEASRSVSDLLSLISRLETEPFWVPSTWLHNTSAH